MGWFGLACIFSTLVVVDGPLLQRASNAVSAPYRNHPVTLSFSMVPEMPRGTTNLERPDVRAITDFRQTTPVSGVPMPLYSKRITSTRPFRCLVVAMQVTLYFLQSSPVLRFIPNSPSSASGTTMKLSQMLYKAALEYVRQNWLLQHWPSPHVLVTFAKWTTTRARRRARHLIVLSRWTMSHS